MHESRLIADLVNRAEIEAAGRPEAITGLRLRLGALCGVPPEALRRGMGQHALDRWGHVPAIVIDESVDPVAPSARGVVLVSIKVEP